ncbi:sialic acid-binding Ig-like lectin 5 [Dunckerocampus dactyliophorus]|uniref:sialic acid-binding Ig-like lectin 5 n=1 Tax=Dunckerocampus dactyliophorus TaxID=161453 RepID=UPI0024070FCF|nr:sialic acid-binding Ig-like lectin 5 [Dunckerocampus dactyliophorus]
MFLLIWTAWLVYVSANMAGAAQSDTYCTLGFCIVLSRRQITSEAGLCAVLPCSYSADGFTPQSVVWFKCDGKKTRCSDSEIVFHSKNTAKAMDGYKGRVSLLGQDVIHKNCSIIINDLTRSDSGSYQLRVNGHLRGKPEGFSFPWRVSLSVKGLEQKPTLSIPSLTAGRPATLTCVAPGLCSGHAPAISWTWRRAGDDDSRVVSHNLTARQTSEGVTSVARRHISTLTFNPSARHHRTRVTCEVALKGGNMTTEETAMLNVSYVKTPSITGQTTVKEGDALNLTCSVDSFPPSRVTWNLLGANVTVLQLGTHTALNPTVGTAHLAIANVSVAQSGRYVCAANHHTATLTVHVDVTVTWFANILDGTGCVVQAAALTCVCISGGVPLPVITWPLLENRSDYRSVTTASNNTVSSSITLTVGRGNLSAVACVSRHKDGQDVKFFNVGMKPAEPEDQSVTTVLRPDVIVAFLVGALLSAILCVLPRTCCRKTKKCSGNQDLELLSPQEEAEETAPKMDGVKGWASNGETKADVEYANINFSALRRNNGREASAKHEATEYAEIKKAAGSNGGKSEQLLERQDKGGDKGGAVMAEDGTHYCEPKQEEEEEEEEALYSNVKDTMMS